jgi:predicted nuclease of predicted toxin-antitoxin system
LVIATRDRDFADLDALFGSPPKVIWICRENAATAEFERLLRVFHEQIEAFGADAERSLLVIS